jgi:hypothetical protein
MGGAIPLCQDTPARHMCCCCRCCCLPLLLSPCVNADLVLRSVCRCTRDVLRRARNAGTLLPLQLPLAEIATTGTHCCSHSFTRTTCQYRCWHSALTMHHAPCMYFMSPLAPVHLPVQLWSRCTCTHAHVHAASTRCAPTHAHITSHICACADALTFMSTPGPPNGHPHAAQQRPSAFHLLHRRHMPLPHLTPCAPALLGTRRPPASTRAPHTTPWMPRPTRSTHAPSYHATDAKSRTRRTPSALHDGLGWPSPALLPSPAAARAAHPPQFHCKSQLEACGNPQRHWRGALVLVQMTGTLTAGVGGTAALQAPEKCSVQRQPAALQQSRCLCRGSSRKEHS